MNNADMVCKLCLSESWPDGRTEAPSLNRFGILWPNGVLFGRRIFRDRRVRRRATSSRTSAGRLTALFPGLNAASLDQSQQYKATHHDGSPDHAADDCAHRSCLVWTIKGASGRSTHNHQDKRWNASRCGGLGGVAGAVAAVSPHDYCTIFHGTEMCTRQPLPSRPTLGSASPGTNEAIKPDDTAFPGKPICQEHK